LIRVIGNLFPLTYFIPIARGIVTKGVGVEYLWEQVIALVLYVVVTVVFAIRAFRQTLD
jgi:ABC-2 type transport system permease protein